MPRKRFQEYVKYSEEELDLYTKTEGSCVHKINTDMRLCIGPFSLADIKYIIKCHIIRTFVGYYNANLGGIVLDIKNIKISSPLAAVRADDPRLHMKFNADVYVFKPETNAILTGKIKHIGSKHVGLILYRVFNVNLRFTHKVDKDEVQLDHDVQFKICKFNLENIFPYIEGELLAQNAVGTLTKKKTIKKEKESDKSDSGIEERDNEELDALLDVIKMEITPEQLQLPDVALKKAKKRKSKCVLEDSTESQPTTNDEIVQDEPTVERIKQEKTQSLTELTPKNKKSKKSKRSKYAEEVEMSYQSNVEEIRIKVEKPDYLEFSASTGEELDATKQTHKKKSSKHISIKKEIL